MLVEIYCIILFFFIIFIYQQQKNFFFEAIETKNDIIIHNL